MRKSELLKLNQKLFESEQKYKRLYSEANEQISELSAEIEKLKNEINELSAKQEASAPLKQLEEKVKNQAKLSDEAKFGASVIGKIVVKATSCCNKLTSSDDGYDPKELVNLILGRTEVAKAEILKAVEADMTYDNKISLIEACQKTAEDYFESVMAQKD